MLYTANVWTKPDIDLSTELRKNAINDFEKILGLTY